MTEPPGLEDRDVADFASRIGLGRAADMRLSRLSGGVSSDVWKVEGTKGTVCVKRALPTLRVATRWEVPVERGQFEARWLKTASGIVPHSVPQIVDYEPHSFLLAMQFFPPEKFPNWRAELLEGRVNPRIAGLLGEMIGKIHSSTADKPEIAKSFQSDALFDALRLDPYFRSLRDTHHDLADRLDKIVERTATCRRVLVHGDVSPKNVLVGIDGPILLDAECAWFGDPAFDVAFLCTHLLLKLSVVPGKALLLRQAYAEYLAGYDSYIAWEPRNDLHARAGDLLAAMLLARTDGKSPVDYLPPATRSMARRFAVNMLTDSSNSPNSILDAWVSVLDSRT